MIVMIGYKMNNFFLYFIFIIVGCSHKPNLEPAEYLIPVHDIDISIDQFAGKLVVNSVSLSRWFKKNGDFGKNVALHDTRLFDNASNDGKCIGVESKQLLKTENELKEYLEYENHVNDICYQILCKEYNVEEISYRENRKQRDVKIKKLLQIIKNESKGIPTHDVPIP